MPSEIKNLFFQNIGVRQTVMKNTFWLFLAEVISRAFGVLVFVYIARALGPQEYGIFAFAFSFVAVLSVLSDFGLIDITTREFSRSEAHRRRLSEMLSLEAVLGLFAIAAIGAASFFISEDASVRQLVFFLGVFAASNSVLGIIISFLRSRQRMEYEAGIKIAQSLVAAGAALLAIIIAPTAAVLGYGYAISGAVFLVACIGLFSIKVQSIRFVWPKDWLQMLHESWPLSFGFIPGWILISLNSVLLGYFGLIEENGWYSAAAKIALVALMPAELVIRSFYPALSNFFITSRENFSRTLGYFSEFMVLLSLPLVFGGLAVAGRLITTVYGDSFTAATPTFKVLIVITAISFLNFPANLLLVVSGRQKRNFFLIATGALAACVLSAVGIMQHGLMGAVYATAISATVLLFVIIWLSGFLEYGKTFAVRLIKVGLVALGASCVMYGVITLPFLASWPVILLCVIGACVYGCAAGAGYMLVFPESRAVVMSIFPWRR